MDDSLGMAKALGRDTLKTIGAIPFCAPLGEPATEGLDETQAATEDVSELNDISSSSPSLADSNKVRKSNRKCIPTTDKLLSIPDVDSPPSINLSSSEPPEADSFCAALIVLTEAAL